MRARYLHAWPALAELYGLHPWDVERLTHAELAEYVTALNERIAHQQRQQRSQGTGNRRR